MKYLRTSSNLLNNSILIMCPYPCQVMHNIQTHKEIVICSKEHSKNSLVYEYRSYTNYNTTVYNNYVILRMHGITGGCIYNRFGTFFVFCV